MIPDVSRIAEVAKAEQIVNSLSSLCETLKANNFFDFGPAISDVNTQFGNLRWYLVSNMRQLLSQMYVEHGIVQTLVDQPVDDAYRAGFEIKTGQLSGDEIERLMIFADREKAIAHVMQGIKWGRLYGGGGVMVITPQNPASPLRIDLIEEDTPLEFRAVDMWELFYSQSNIVPTLEVGGQLGAGADRHYDYYGVEVHKSRVHRIVGKEPPAFIRPRLRGWGMSEIERLVRSLNQYMKNQDVIFELLDEAKVDVYKIKGFNTSLLNTQGTAAIAKRIEGANIVKNYNHALTMDAEDDYAQKQIAFTGLAEVLLQIRQGIAADLKMPMTKLFGISAAGFSSGEDDIENYNSMLESEIRNKTKFLVVDILGICCQKLFGFVPDDLMITFNPLRILNALEEEQVKDSQFTRVMSAYTSGLASAKEAKQAMNRDSLLGVEVDENSEALPPLEVAFGQDEPKPKAAKGSPGKTAPKAA